MKKIGIDASGGDYGYSEIVPGAIQASAVSPYEIAIYGNGPVVRENTPDNSGLDNVRIVHCRRPNDELAEAFKDLARNNLDAIVTASNSQRLLTYAKAYYQEGVSRPGLLAPFPIKDKMAYLLDVGATARVSDPAIFLGWAKVGSNFLREHLNINDPKIGLLNIAAERACPEISQIHRALESIPGYVGYVEPKRFFQGEIDLWLMEGFVGNAFLKLIEEVLPLTIGFCCQELVDMPVAQLRLHEIAQKHLSYEAHLISPLLGLKGMVFRIHGCCRAEQIAQSFQAVKRYVE